MTKRVHRSADKKYHIGGKAYIHLVGSRRQVFEGYAYKTAGDLCKRDLVRNKYGRYVSRSKHASATREKRLQKHGYTAIKGKFGAVKMTAIQRRGSRTARRVTRGGCGVSGGNTPGDSVPPVVPSVDTTVVPPVDTTVDTPHNGEHMP
jgi:hypothetical protein